MAKVICFENDLGYASIIFAVPELYNGDSALRQELAAQDIVFNTEEEMLEWVAQKDVPPNKQYFIIDEALLPKDKMYRNAWSLSADKSQIEIPLEKAKPLHQDLIRNARNKQFDSADVDFNKSLELVMDKLIAANPADPDYIELKANIDKRNALRDAPAINLDDVQSIDELKLKIPDVLK